MAVYSIHENKMIASLAIAIFCASMLAAMPGFQPRYEYFREMKRDGVLPVDFDPKNPTPVNAYELDQKYWQQFWVTPVNPNEVSK
jgi:hypothetical protein